MYGGSVKGELCTPTGAALLKHFVTKFADMPVMQVSAIGYGMGKKDFELANCVRVMLGETQSKADSVYELSCNIDDMTGEEIGFAMDVLFEAGALDVYTENIGMKKSRPGIKLNVLCKEENKSDIVKCIFKHTTTIGVRETKLDRFVLDREIEEVNTRYGTIRKKTVSGFGVSRSKYEYDDLIRVAKEQGISLSQLKKEL